MSGEIRVLWLTKGLGRGGAERLLVSSAEHRDRSRFVVEVAYLLPWKDALVGELQQAGVPVRCLGQRWTLDYRWVLRLHRSLRAGGIDIVHTHMPLAAVGARLATLGTGVKVVHTEHNMWDRYRTPTRWANAVTYRRNAAVIAVSQAVADTIGSRWMPAGDTVRVVYHGIDQPSLALTRDDAAVASDRLRAREVLGLPQDAFVVGTVGNLTPKKDHAGLLDAFAELRRHHPESHLVLVGDGPLREVMADRSSRPDLLGSVHLTGQRDDVRSLLPALDVFVLSSRFEGLSIALVEALAAGLPSVVTSVGGITEVVTHEREALVVPPSDPTALAAALVRLAEDPAARTRMSAAARQRATVFDIERATREIEAVYAGLMVMQ